ncbi:MAG: DNA repair protein RecO [Candidatus Omnitrophica bacterium]|nr:DNA repair protein RecO [Candidatus Omnitrophota bacterium]
MPIYHSEAITLRRRRTREADALVTFWCRSFGRVVASTRSVLKTSSRYAGVTQPFNRLQVIFYAKTDEQDIWTLTQASLIESYDGIHNDLVRISYASNLIEWIEALSGDFQSSERVWRILTECLTRWNRHAPREEELFYYQMHLLIDAGQQPDMGACQNCGKTLDGAWNYISSTGGIFCHSCRTEGLSLSGGAVEILRRLSETTRPPTIRMSEQQRREIRSLLQTHGIYHAGLQSRAAQFQDQMQQEKSPR